MLHGKHEIKQKAVTDIQLENRSCDFCEDDDLQELWNFTYTSSTINNFFHWNVRNVACRKCGFIFVSPAPSKTSLERYYRDSYSPVSLHKIDYSIDNRVELLQKYQNINKAKTYIEIGSNNCPEFLSKLSHIFENLETIEVNQSCARKYSSMDAMKSIDRANENIISAYFVLEHVPDVVDFLTTCRGSLSEQGYLILEVPDLYLYPKDIAGLIWHEHVNHFSPKTLSMIAEKCGLEVIETSHNLCSRSFGFVCVFRKCPPKRRIVDISEFENAVSSFRDGLKVVNAFDAKLEEIRSKLKLLRGHEQALIWVANHTCERLLCGLPITSNITVVDADPRKRHFLTSVEVSQPDAIIDKIHSPSLLVINSKTHSSDIQTWILNNTGAMFRDIIVLDPQ